MATRRLSVLTALLTAMLVSSGVHYTDNYIAFDGYPGSGSLARIGVPIAWVLFTAVGIAGYALYRRGERGYRVHLLLGAYSFVGLTTLAHYLYGSPADLPTLRNVSILSDGVIGAAVLSFVVWSWTHADERRPAAALSAGAS